jgi:sugar transferase (PEP-CTERM system associated)
MVRVFNQYVSLKSLLLILLEDILIVGGLFCGAKLRFWGNLAEFYDFVQFPNFGVQSLIVVLAVQICFYYSDLYSFTHIRSRNGEVVDICQSIGIACLILGVVYYIFPALLLGRGVFFIGVGISGALVFSSRLLLDRAWRAAAPQHRVLILGSGEPAITIARELTRRGDLNVHLAGLVHEEDDQSGAVFGYPILGGMNRLEEIAARHGITRIIVALADRRGVLPVRELVTLRVQGIIVEDVHSAIAALSGRVWLSVVKPGWFVFSEGFHRSRSTLVTKRCLDVLFSVFALIVSLPVMAAVALAVRLDSKGPVLYRQTRVGRGGRCFEVLKFRSMSVNAETGKGAQWAKQNDPRVTRIGRYLRKYRLDEFPQLINVIRGDMSFVGPRPERPAFVEMLRKKIPYYDERHSVRPGITGWAQVRYDYGATVEDALRKLEYELFYLQNMSAFFDLAIMVATVRVMLTGSGAR